MTTIFPSPLIAGTSLLLFAATTFIAVGAKVPTMIEGFSHLLGAL